MFVVLAKRLGVLGCFEAFWGVQALGGCTLSQAFGVFYGTGAEITSAVRGMNAPYPLYPYERDTPLPY
jgi:hypothetical protein